VSSKSSVVETVVTYDVDRTLDGFRLILFLVRASGTGMLCRKGGEERKEWDGWRWAELKSNANHTSVPNVVNHGAQRSQPHQSRKSRRGSNYLPLR